MTEGQGEGSEKKPFWGLVNGKPLKIRTMGATGPFGSGKSLLGDMIDPKNTFKIDIESSSTTFNLPFKRHVVLYEEIQGKTETDIATAKECFEWFDAQMRSIEPGEYTVVSVDPINEIQQGCYDWVVDNPHLFGRTRAQYEKMTALAWGDVKTYLDMLVGILSSKIETFYYTLHMGQVWKNGKPVEGKMKAKGSDVFRKMADVLFVLSRPVDPKTGKQVGAPIGICSGADGISKSRLTHANPETGEILPILPPAIHGLTPQKIREYIAKPPNYKKLRKGELMPVQELTEDERLQLEVQKAEAIREAEELRNERMRGAEEAARRNLEAKAKAQRESVAPTAPESADTCSASPSSSGDLSRDEMIERIKQTAVAMFGKQKAKEVLKRAVQKRGGFEARMADLTDEQIRDIHDSIEEKWKENLPF